VDLSGHFFLPIHVVTTTTMLKLDQAHGVGQEKQAENGVDRSHETNLDAKVSQKEQLVQLVHVEEDIAETCCG